MKGVEETWVHQLDSYHNDIEQLMNIAHGYVHALYDHILQLNEFFASHNFAPTVAFAAFEAKRLGVPVAV